MSLSKEEVKKIAFLARIGLNDAELDHLAPQLADIINYVEILNEVDTDDVKPTYQVTGLNSVSEEDMVIDFVDNKDRLLECTNLKTYAHQIVVKSVFNG